MAGKDRTGVLAAILLAVLGVADDTIGADYSLTERSFDAAFTWANEHEPDWATWISHAEPTGLLTSPADVIIDFLAKLRAECGSVDDYLAQGGLNAGSLQALRDQYLV